MARTKRGLATREAFREGARRVFARDGYLNARLADIAEEADRSPGLLYQHYDGKPELLADLADNFLKELREEVTQPSKLRPGGPESLRESIEAFWNHYRRRMAEVIGITQAASVDPDFAARWHVIHQEATEMVARGIRRAQQEGYCPGIDPILTATALTLMIENFCTFWQYQGGVPGVEISDEEAIDTLWQLWTHAIYWKPAADAALTEAHADVKL